MRDRQHPRCCLPVPLTPSQVPQLDRARHVRPDLQGSSHPPTPSGQARTESPSQQKGKSHPGQFFRSAV
jgi:hypothetical protein